VVSTRHVFETYIRSTPDKVWEALTDPAFTRQFFFGLAVNAGWEADTPYSYDSEQGPAIEGTIEEIDRPRHLVMTFKVLFDADAGREPPSRVAWELTPVGTTVRVTCIHSDLALSPRTWTITADGWNIILCGLKSFVETGTGLGDVPDDGRSPFAPNNDMPADVTWHRRAAIEANSGVYELLDNTCRGADDDARMVHMAHASAHHWAIAGGVEHRARAEYLCSHVYAYLGRAEPALLHARRCIGLCDDAGLQDFDRAFAHEAMARALACAGELDAAALHLVAARAVPIADPEDHAICEADLLAGPWYGLDVTPSEPAPR
jgi:uncharacterized protein YndB with AHSA1/START domain